MAREHAFLHTGILFLALFMLAPGAAHSKSQSISVDNRDIRIGANKQETLKELRLYYRVDCGNEDCNSVLIMSKHGPPFNIYANVNFEEDRVVRAIKYWGGATANAQERPVAFVRNLFGLLSNIEDEGRKIVSIDIYESHSPQMHQQKIVLDFGGKEVSIDLVDGVSIDGVDMSPQVSLDEIIR